MKTEIKGGQFNRVAIAVNEQQGPVNVDHEDRIRAWATQRVGEGNNDRFPEVKGRTALPASGTVPVRSMGKP